MRAWVTVWLVVTLALVCAPTASALPRLTHSGRWLVDPQGRVVVLHGLVIDRWRADHRVNIVDLDPANIDLLADQGFNAARVNVTWSGYEPQSGRRDDAYLDPFVALDHRLARHHVYDLLTSMQGQYAEALNGWGFPDWTVMTDGAPDGAEPFPQGYLANPAEDRAWDHFWADSAGIQTRYDDFLTRLAARFAHAPGLLGIDVLNEPWPGSPGVSCASPAGCPPGGFDATSLTDFANRAVAAVRSVDPRRPVFVEPNLLFDFGSDTGLGKLADANTALAFHVYCLAYLFGGADPGQDCGTGEGLSFDHADAYARRTGAGVLMDEVGNTPDPVVNDRLAAEADAHMVGWTFWALEDCCHSTAAVVADGSKPPTATGNLRAGVLGALVRRTRAWSRGRRRVGATTRRPAPSRCATRPSSPAGGPRRGCRPRSSCPRCTSRTATALGWPALG